MIIAIDYDNTYTCDTGLWDSFILLAKASGHEVICFAQRDPSEQIYVTASPAMALHYIGTQRKTVYAKRKGLAVDIWIDDNPDAL